MGWYKNGGRVLSRCTRYPIERLQLSILRSKLGFVDRQTTHPRSSFVCELSCTNAAGRAVWGTDTTDRARQPGIAASSTTQCSCRESRLADGTITAAAAATTWASAESGLRVQLTHLTAASSHRGSQTMSALTGSTISWKIGAGPPAIAGQLPTRFLRPYSWKPQQRPMHCILRSFSDSACVLRPPLETTSSRAH